MEICMNEICSSPFEELSSSFSYIETIASGSFGTVVRAENNKTKQEVAVKIINKTRFKIDSAKIKQEIMILKQLDHPNIVRFLDYIETTNTIFIIMEYISKTTLSSYISNNKGKITEETASTIMKHLLHAIQYIHSKNICHRDIKPENIMFTNENDLSSLKLIDFGLSAQHREYFLLPEFCGTLIYMSPEQIKNKNYTQGVDIWSAGVILYLLLNQGEHPFYQDNDSKHKYISKIKQGKFKQIKQCSEMALHIIKVMLEPSPHIRISAQNALKHPWITRRMFDNIPHNVYESLSQSTVHQKVQNILVLAIFMKRFRIENTNSRNNSSSNSNSCNSNSNRFVNEEYEMKIKKTNNEGKVYFQHKRISMFEVKCNNNHASNSKDSYDSNTKLSENNEQESTNMNSITSTSLVSSRVKQKPNLTAITKQQIYLLNTPKKSSDKIINNNNNNNNNNNMHSLIKRSYSSLEVKSTTNITHTKQKSIRSKFFSPKHITQHEEYNYLHFQNSLRSHFSPIKNQKLLSQVKKNLHNELSMKDSSHKKDIKIPITISKTLKQLPMFQITSRKDNICPLILPKIKLKSAQHLINVKIPRYYINY